MAGTPGSERTIGQLVADATHDLQGLVRGEIALAKAEVTSGARVLGKGAGLLAGAAFFASGVTVIGGGFAAAATDEVAIAVVCALVIGKLTGVFGTTWLMARFTRAELGEGLSWRDVGGLALLTGVGFTVSLLVGDLAFGEGSERNDHVKLAVLVGSLLAAILASIVLRMRNTHYRQIAELESHDGDADGIPDVYQRDDSDR